MENNQNCTNHPERAALEHCEVCGAGLCGYCLYYTEDGQRLCEIHAQRAKANGVRVIPPAVYAEGIIPSQAVANQQQDTDKPKGVMTKPQAFYQGNNQDLNAFVAMLLGVVSFVSCCGATCLLPFLAFLLGVLALINAKDAFDPRRTRQQAWIGILTGGVLVGFVVLCMGGYAVFYGSIITSISSSNNFSPYMFPTSTYTPFPTDTPAPNVEPFQLTATARANQNQSPAPTKTP